MPTATSRPGRHFDAFYSPIGHWANRFDEGLGQLRRRATPIRTYGGTLPAPVSVPTIEVGLFTPKVGNAHRFPKKLVRSRCWRSDFGIDPLRGQRASKTFPKTTGLLLKPDFRDFECDHHEFLYSKYLISLTSKFWEMRCFDRF